MATPREVLDEVAPGVRVRYRRSEPPPPYTYAVTVEVEVAEESWTSVRLWDNADDVHEHHVHRYTQQGGKAKSGDSQIQIDQRSNGRGQ